MEHKRTRYQHGSLKIEARKTGPDVYVFRWREKTSAGTVKRKAILGTVKELSKTQAQQKSEIYRKQANCPSPEPESKTFTVAALSAHYATHELGENCGKTAKVRKAYESILQRYVTSDWGSKTLPSVKAIAVEEWLKQLPLANGSKAKVREVFGAIFRHGIRHELCSVNPIQSVRQVRKRATEPDILEPGETAAVLKELDGIEPVRTAFLAAALTGMRRGELFGLQWQDLDLDRGTVHVRRSVVDGVEGPPKTDSSRRPLPLSGEVCAALSEWRRRTTFNKPGNWVFASEVSFGKQPLWPATLWRRHVAPALLRAGITKRLGWHSLRRSYASLLLHSGASLRLAMEMMRHSTAEMTLATYAQTVGDEKRQAGNRVEAMLMGPKEVSGPTQALQPAHPVFVTPHSSPNLLN